MGESARDGNPMTPKCTLILGVALM